MTRAARLRGYLLAIGLAISCLASSGAAAQSQTWERHNAAGLAALEARHFTEARQRFAVALREAERQGPVLSLADLLYSIDEDPDWYLKEFRQHLPAWMRKPSPIFSNYKFSSHNQCTPETSIPLLEISNV